MSCYVYSLELSDPFTEPLYEKVLRSVKDLKRSVTSIVKAQGKTSSVRGQCVSPLGGLFSRGLCLSK